MKYATNVWLIQVQLKAIFVVNLLFLFFFLDGWGQIVPDSPQFYPILFLRIRVTERCFTTHGTTWKHVACVLFLTARCRQKLHLKKFVFVLYLWNPRPPTQWLFLPIFSLCYLVFGMFCMKQNMGRTLREQYPRVYFTIYYYSSLYVPKDAV